MNFKLVSFFYIYRLYGRRFLQVWWPNQQCQSTEGGWL